MPCCTTLAGHANRPPRPKVLAAHGREQVTPHWPDALATELEVVNDELIGALDHFTHRWFGDTAGEHRRIITSRSSTCPPVPSAVT